MKRSGWVFLGLAAVVATGLLAAFLGPRGPEEFPLAELVPQDAVFYAGFTDYRRFEELVSKIPGAWREEDRKRFEEAKPHFAGAIAFFVDPKGEWVGLARLTRAAAIMADVEGDAAVFAQTPAALGRFRARIGSIRDVPAFRALKSRFFLNLEPFDFKGRLGDHSAVGFEIEGNGPWTVRGCAAYRPDRYRFYIERYVQIPPRAASVATGAPAQLVLTDPFLRLWDEILEGLAPDERDRVERESQVLRRDLLAGHEVREFLGRLGPRWGAAVLPTPRAFPALVAWLDLPDDAARETLEKMLVRAARDADHLSRGRGQVPGVEVEKREGEALWRLKFTWAPKLRLGDAFAPAYAFSGNRLVFTTCASVLAPPEEATGDAHAALSLQVAPAVELLRSMAPFFADGTFRSEADGMAVARYFREFNPVKLAVRTDVPRDPYERERHLAMRRAEFVAEALAEIASGQKYKDELARREKSIAAWAERLSGIDRVAGSGRFTGHGLAFEIRTWPKEIKR